jgi:hypothetical protein
MYSIIQFDGLVRLFLKRLNLKQRMESQQYIQDDLVRLYLKEIESKTEDAIAAIYSGWYIPRRLRQRPA